MDLTRRSLFGMLLVAPLAGVLAKKSASAIPSEYESLSLFNGTAILHDVSIGGHYAEQPFVNRPSKNWAKHADSCWLAQPASPEESAWFAEHFRKLWDIGSPRYWRDRDPSQLSLF